MNTEALDRAVSIVGSMRELAEKLGVTKGAVGQWKMPGRQIPAEHCPLIERLTNGDVRCESLRPDVDWSYLRTNCVHQEKIACIGLSGSEFTS